MHLNPAIIGIVPDVFFGPHNGIQSSIMCSKLGKCATKVTHVARAEDETVSSN